MKKSIILFTALIVGTSNLLLAQSGKVFDDLSMNSEILQGERKYAIYLPPDYETSQHSYPVLYLLHGGGDDQTGWVQFGEVLHIADKAIREGKATPMIVAMPDANTGRRGYFNDISGTWRYEDFFFEEFMPYIEKTYRIKGEKRYRAVAGLSMGGSGTLMYALHHPELFSSACPLSTGGGGAFDLEGARSRYTRDGGTYSDAEIEAYAKRHNAIELVDALTEDQVDAVRWYMDSGDDDRASEGMGLLHIAMNRKGIAHEFRVRDGAHTWTYWRTALPEVLAFISQAFHQY